MSTRHSVIAALLVSIVAVLVFCWGTPYGLTVESGDAVVYLESAHNIAAGHGFVFAIPPLPPTSVNHFPPLYPMAIAAGQFFTHDVRAGAYLVNIVAVFAAVLFASLLVLETVPGAIWGVAFVGPMILLNPILLRLYCTVLSEPIFLSMGLVGQWLLVRFAKMKKTGLLVTAAVILGLTPLARFSGVVWIATGVLFLFFCGRVTWLARTRDAAVFLFISCLPTAALVVRNRLSSGTSSDRGVGWHMMGWDHLNEALVTVSSWFLPWRWMNFKTGIAVTVLCAVLVIVLIVAWRRMRTSDEANARSLYLFGTSTLLFLAVYLAHLLLAISAVNYNTPLDGRILAPVTVSLICIMAVALALVRPGVLRAGAVVVGALLVSVSAGRAAGWLVKNRKEEVGYLAPAWMKAKTAQYVRELPPSVMVYSNRPEQLYFSLRRPVQSIPFKADPMTQAANPKVDSELQTMKDELQSTKGFIVYFPPPKYDVTYTANGGAAAPLSRLHEFSIGELEQKLHLQRQLTDDLADIYRVAP